MKTVIKNIFYEIYYLTLMPYFERDRYFKMLCDKMDNYINENLL
jgi:hypothetical protein